MRKTETLKEHVSKVLKGERQFENVFQTVNRMILGNKDSYTKIKHNGRSVYDFNVFREGKKHIIGMYDEINSFVSFVKDAAEGGSSKEMCFCSISAPGTGKTFFVEYLCDAYRKFLSKPENRKYTFRFKIPKEMDQYGRLHTIESQTYEDPMVLAYALERQYSSKSFLGIKPLISKDKLNMFEENYRPLGACSDYILNDLFYHFNEDVDKILDCIEVVPVPMSPTLGTVTGKYSARDKITSSAKDLLGEESVQRLLHITDTNNPYRIDLRIGALARVGGGGIHFSDEMFKNKKDLVQVYLGVIQNRNIEIDGYKWPLDTLIIATSNNDEFNTFVSEKEEAPIIDRCRICYVGHNTNYKLQKTLTEYAIGSNQKTTMNGKKLHIDPNLNFAISNTVILTRLPHCEKLSPLEIRKLAAGEIAGDKSIKTLTEFIDELQREIDVTKRFGQNGIGHRNLGRALQLLMENSETQDGNCMCALNIFDALEQIVLDYIQDKKFRSKFLDDIELGKSLYKEKIRTSIFDAYMDEPQSIKKEVINYVNMIIAIDSQEVTNDNMFKYNDPATGETKAIKIDESYIKSVEDRLGLKSDEQKEGFRTTIRKIYGRKCLTDPNYNFMDNNELVKAVTEVRLNSDIAGAGSLVGALANRTNDENKALYNRMLDTMMNKLGYCKTCSEKTIDYFCTRDSSDI